MYIKKESRSALTVQGERGLYDSMAIFRWRKQKQKKNKKNCCLLMEGPQHYRPLTAEDENPDIAGCHLYGITQLIRKYAMPKSYASNMI